MAAETTITALDDQRVRALAIDHNRDYLARAARIEGIDPAAVLADVAGGDAVLLYGYERGHHSKP